jgi:cytochrome oxidase Cu insertion factor (SCO1/SenC/PrrC family)
MKRRFVRFIVLSALGCILGAGFALMQKPEGAVVKDTSSTPVAGVPVGGAFSLVDHKGQPVTEKSWPGKKLLVFFGFTHCPDICPTSLQKIAAVMEKVDPKGQKIVPLLITVDPARDTPKVMADYVKNFSPLIVGLTGTPEQIKSVEAAYKVYTAKREEKPTHEHAEGHAGGHNDYMVDHSGYIYLMSPENSLLHIFSMNDSAEEIIAKIE